VMNFRLNSCSSSLVWDFLDVDSRMFEHVANSLHEKILSTKENDVI
jgi:hypothetical protein